MNLLRGARGSEAFLGSLVLAGLVVATLFGNGNDAAGDTFATDDFRSGGYAAFLLLLQREGVAAESFERRPAALDAHVDTLIVAYPAAGAQSAARLAPDRAALRAWVAGGGRLVALGTERPFAEISAGKNSPPVAVALEPPRVMHSGRGLLVIVADPRRFDNAHLGAGENARVAYALARPRRAGGVVAFDETVHGRLTDRHWWQTLDAAQRVALGGILLAVLIALAGGALRLGPAVALCAAREPASDEFVAALAALYRRSGARHAALALLAHGAREAHGAAARRLHVLAELPAPADRDLIAGARLARTIREAG